MKKFLFLAFAAFAALSANAQKNLFPTSDGWIWFNNQETVDEYVGDINTDDEEKFLVETGANKKIIQKVFANQQPDYPETTVDISVQGAGTDGTLGSDGCRTGAIILAPSSGIMNYDGGGIVLALPACSTLSMCLSSESSVKYRLTATKNTSNDVFTYHTPAEGEDYTLYGDKGWYVIKVTSIFNKLQGTPGILTWEGIEELNNNSDVTIQSSDSIYVFFMNATHDNVYIHGIKVTIPESAGISELTDNGAQEDAVVYNLNGTRVATTNTENLKKGVYIVKRGSKSNKILVR